MNQRDSLRRKLVADVRAFERNAGTLPGLAPTGRRGAFVEQLVDSVRRVEYVQTIRQRPISSIRLNPDSPKFCPIRGSILLQRKGDIDEACWLIFLSVHCGKHRKDGWKLVSDLYGGSGVRARWKWHRVSGDAKGFRDWLDEAVRLDRASFGRFGNHRRYESLSGNSGVGTGAVIESYVNWILEHKGHDALFSSSIGAANAKDGDAFDLLFRGMAKNVIRFGRLGSFDYLCMLNKVGLLSCFPRTPYIEGSSGPSRGARLLFGIEYSKVLNERAAVLADNLGLNMQVVEDALCNWQKSPDQYIYFRG